MEKPFVIYEKYRQIISYLFWGIITTIINVGIFECLYLWANWNYMVNNTIAWFVSVLVAYLSNRAYVFHSITKGIRAYIHEVDCKINPNAIRTKKISSLKWCLPQMKCPIIVRQIL